MVSLPTFTTLPLPGNRRRQHLTPRFCAAARTLAEASSDTVEPSIRIFGLSRNRQHAALAMVTSFRSSEAETMVKTMSQDARSAGLTAILAPDLASGSALARVRL